MTSWQKFVKYCALGLAVIIIAGVIGFIADAFLDLFSIFDLKDDNSVYVYTEIMKEEIHELNIELKNSSLEIISGDEFSIESNNSKLKYNYENGVVTLKENSSIKHKDYKTVITIPKDMILNDVNIDMKYGDVSISKFKCKDFELENKAGDTGISNLYVTNEFEMDMAIGNTEITDSNINNLEFKGGVGDFNYSGIINGDSEINLGVGNTYIKIASSINEFNYDINKGLGEITINNKEVSSGLINNNANKTIKINGGLGNITIYE